jgi:hypothetical protein
MTLLSKLSVGSYMNAMDIVVRSQQSSPPTKTQPHLAPSEQMRLEKFNLALGMPPWMTSKFIKDLSIEDFIKIHTVILKEKTVDEFLKKISESSINVTELKKISVLFNYLKIDYNEKNKNLFIKFRLRLYPNMNFIDLLKDKQRQRKNKSKSMPDLEAQKAILKNNAKTLQQALNTLPKDNP